MSNFINVEKLKGGKDTNWMGWKVLAKGMLITHDLWECVLGTDEGEGADRRKAKAAALLLCNLESSVVSVVGAEHHSDPKAIWEDLSKKFEPKSSTLYLTLKQQIAMMPTFTERNALEKIEQCESIYERMTTLGRCSAAKSCGDHPVVINTARTIEGIRANGFLIVESLLCCR